VASTTSTTQVLLTGPGRVELRHRRLEPVRSGRALIRVIQCGLCASEADQWLGRSGRYPVEIGHEVAGVVEEIAPDDEGGPLSADDHVVAWVTGGGFTERHTRAPRQRLSGRGGAAGVLRERRRTRRAEGGRRCGDHRNRLHGPAHPTSLGAEGRPIGHRGGPPSRRPGSLRRAGRDPGVVDLRTESLADVVAADTENGGADVTYEATGAQDALTLAGQVTRTSGTITIVGYHQGEPRTVDLAHWNERASGSPMPTFATSPRSWGACVPRSLWSTRAGWIPRTS
jgi:threonine dehydrogenase-like Zn-dependent dehydrogenase